MQLATKVYYLQDQSICSMNATAYNSTKTY